MSDLLNVGRITGVFGIKGWLKVISQTEPADNVFAYQPWLLKTREEVRPVELVKWEPHGKGFIVQLAHIDNRNEAEQLCTADIVVEKSAFPPLDEGDFYWYQLEGLRVVSDFQGQSYNLGVVKKIFSTNGSNDVLVVVGDEKSIDQKERLLPYLLGRFVNKVDIINGVIAVDWDPEF